MTDTMSLPAKSTGADVLCLSFSATVGYFWKSNGREKELRSLLFAKDIIKHESELYCSFCVHAAVGYLGATGEPDNPD